MSGKEITGFKPGSKSWKKFMAKVYGWGGALVIVGAMFKIQHWPGAAIMLIGGLGVEAMIFILSAFEPLHEDPDWSLVYPELGGVDEVELDDNEAFDSLASSSNDKPITEQLDNMLQEAKIGPELIESLGLGLKGLSEQATKLSSISDASVATQEFSTSLKNASQTVSSLSEGYVKASEAITGLASGNEEGANFGVQMQKVAKNLAELNSVYELQLQGASTHYQETTRLYSGMSELLANLNDSVEDTKRYKESMSELSQNLTALNKVYGNMLSAMSAR